MSEDVMNVETEATIGEDQAVMPDFGPEGVDSDGMSHLFSGGLGLGVGTMIGRSIEAGKNKKDLAAMMERIKFVVDDDEIYKNIVKAVEATPKKKPWWERIRFHLPIEIEPEKETTK